MIKWIPLFPQLVYSLFDSWFTSRSIIETVLPKGINLIGALKDLDHRVILM